MLDVLNAPIGARTVHVETLGRFCAFLWQEFRGLVWWRLRRASILQDGSAEIMACELDHVRIAIPFPLCSQCPLW